MSHDIVDSLFSYSGEIVIDLQDQTVTTGSQVFNFDVDPERKRRLLHGLDDIGLTLQYENQIRSFENNHFNKFPWL